MVVTCDDGWADTLGKMLGWDDGCDEGWVEGLVVGDGQVKFA